MAIYRVDYVRSYVTKYAMVEANNGWNIPDVEYWLPFVTQKINDYGFYELRA